MSKKIGFIDYYISEWHANNYPDWIKSSDKKLGYDYEVSYGWAERDVSPVDGATTEEWCQKMNVIHCNTIEEVCEKSDVIIILSPSDPDKHLEYVKRVFPFGKPTYVDKTFASDLNEAKEIFQLSSKYNTPFFSTSALRFAEELNDFKSTDNILITGGGGNFEEYIIHTAEMAVILLNDTISKVKVDCLGKQRICKIVTQNGKNAAIIYSPFYDFRITAENKNKEYIQKDVTSEYFKTLLDNILIFFETGKKPFNIEQTLDVMNLRTLLLYAQNHDSNWIESEVK